MHNDVVKLRAGAVQREANHTGRSFQNLDSSHAARQLQPHVLPLGCFLHQRIGDLDASDDLSVGQIF